MGLLQPHFYFIPIHKIWGKAVIEMAAFLIQLYLFQLNFFYHSSADGSVSFSNGKRVVVL